MRAPTPYLALASPYHSGSSSSWGFCAPPPSSGFIFLTLLHREGSGTAHSDRGACSLGHPHPAQCSMGAHSSGELKVRAGVPELCGAEGQAPTQHSAAGTHGPTHTALQHAVPGHLEVTLLQLARTSSFFFSFLMHQDLLYSLTLCI